MNGYKFKADEINLNEIKALIEADYRFDIVDEVSELDVVDNVKEVLNNVSKL